MHVMKIAEISLRRLRNAIQNNEISFPSQVPIFPRQSRADIQWRLVGLYFIRNWSCARLGRRYALTEERVQQIIRQWVRRAKLLGYLQEIPLVTQCLTNEVRADPAELIVPAWTLNSDGVRTQVAASLPPVASHMVFQRATP